MDDIKETTQKLSKSGFVQHVFNFDESTKKYIMNCSQYTLVVLPLSIFINKILEDFISEFDDSKGNFEVLAEVIIHFLVMIVGIFIIHRIATYLPTYSGTDYENINLFSIIIVAGFLLYYSQSSLGLNILSYLLRFLKFQRPLNFCVFSLLLIFLFRCLKYLWNLFN